MHRVYLASPFGMQEFVRSCERSLVTLGYVSTSRWLTQEPSFTGPGGTTINKCEGKVSKTWQACYDYSVRDIYDVIDCDTLIHFGSGIPLERNTHLAELGGALFTGRQVIEIQPEAEDKKDVIGCIFEHFHTVPSLWSTYCPELRKIKPVVRYRSFDALIVDLMNPIKRECKENCGCDNGCSGWETATGIMCLAPIFPDTTGLARIPVRR